MSSHNKMKAAFDKYKGQPITNDKYEGLVCGYHFKWDDGDQEKLIVAITKEKSIRPGIRYMLRGDVFVTHKQNELGYDFIPVPTNQ